MRRVFPSHVSLLPQADALGASTLRRVAGPKGGAVEAQGSSRDAAHRLNSPPVSLRTGGLLKPGSPIETGRLATDSSSSLYRPILQSPKNEQTSASGLGRPSLAHALFTSARGFPKDLMHPSSSNRGLSDSFHTEVVTQEQFLNGTADLSDLKSFAGTHGLHEEDGDPRAEQGLRRENAALREYIRTLEADMSFVLRLNESLLHKLSTFSTNLPSPH
jgi:hypothetical protein